MRSPKGIDDHEAAEILIVLQIRVRLRYQNALTSAARMLFGGAEYGDAGLTLTVGHVETQ